MVDNTQADGSITASPAADEANSVAAPQQDTGNAAPNGSGDAAQDASPSETQPANDDPRSLTSQTGPQHAEKTQAQVDWERRYHEMAKGVGKVTNEVGQLRKYKQEMEQRYQGIDPQTVEAWKQQKALAEQKQLPKWHRNNPDRPMFQQQVGEYRRLQSAFLRAKTPEAQEAIVAELEQFPQDVRTAIGDFQKHRASLQDRLAEELTGYNSLEEMIAEKAAAVVAQEQAKVKAETDVNQWFDDQANKPIVEYTSPAMQEALQDGVPLPYVKRLAELTYQLDMMKSSLSTTGQAAASIQARTQAAKANASITRDAPMGSRKADPVAIAKERGIDISSTAYAHLLSELHSKNLL